MLNKYSPHFWLLCLSVYSTEVLAYIAPKSYVDDGGIVGRVNDFQSSINDFLNVVLFVSGVGVLFGAMSQYGKYKSHPESVKFGAVLATFCAALALMGLAFLPMPGI
ncbi:MAG TPA: hypothetical protein QF353_06110 [Gammaproteobacteria bacterium]|nr:hypothetical protein [Gammaproteobacteria bacterium]